MHRSFNCTLQQARQCGPPACHGIHPSHQPLTLHTCCLLPPADQFRGASALVRMASVEAAERAITTLNNSTPPGAVQSLIVRFAESAAEKAARLSRREAKTLQRLGGGMGLAANGMAAGSAAQLQQALSALSLGGGAPAAGGLPAAPLRNQLPPAPLVPQLYQPQVLSSICIKGELTPWTGVKGQLCRSKPCLWLHTGASSLYSCCHACPKMPLRSPPCVAAACRHALQCGPSVGV